LTFEPGTLVDGLAQGIPAIGTITGPTQNLITTDADGLGRIRVQSSDPENFFIAQLPQPVDPG